MGNVTGMFGGVGEVFSGLSDKISIGVGNIADAAPDYLDTARDTAVDAGQKTSSWAEETVQPVKDWWNGLGSPDGVQTALDAQVAAAAGNSTLTAFAEFKDASEAFSTNHALLADKAAVSAQNLFYTKDYQGLIYPDKDGNKNPEKGSTLGKRPYSIFNKYSLINYKGSPISGEEGPSADQNASYNIVNPADIMNPSASQIIKMTKEVDNNFGYRYDYADFALAKYFNRLPNNMMLTLRRFAFPCPDDIVSPKDIDGKLIPQPDIARAITWLGEASGNSMAEIMQFSHGLNWKDVESQMQTLNSQKGAASGSIGSLVNTNKFLQAGVTASRGMNAVDVARNEANAGFDYFSNTYPNHVYGPLNVIKNMVVRDQGLKFNQEFTLKFEYEMRELGGANPKILMLDQLSNLLALTYNNAPFWGGDVRYIGDGSIGRPLGDNQYIKNGDYAGFFKSVINDVSGKGKSGGGSWGDVLNNAAGAFKDFLQEGKAGKALGNILGGSMLELFNSPQGGQAVNSFLTGDPTGQWHLTIGNPLNPMAVIGNLVCTDTKISFAGDLGPNDFPEKLIMEVSLKPGRPRDKAEIESMFNAGRGRFYIQPDDTADINNTFDVSAYGNKDRRGEGSSKYTNTFRKYANG